MPGLVAVIMMIISAMLTALTVAREWERARWSRLPARRSTRSSDRRQAVPYLGIGLMTSRGARDRHAGLRVPFRGDAALLFIAVLFLFGSLASASSSARR